MKKLLILLTVLVPLIYATSCNDDDDLPNVKFNVAITGGQFVGEQIYVVSGDTLSFDSVGVINNDAGKAALITYANYYWDYQFIGQNMIPPFGYNIYINESIPLGRHLLEIYAPVYAVDKSPAFAIYAVFVNVVGAAEDIPENGTEVFVATPSIQLNDPSK